MSTQIPTPAPAPEPESRPWQRRLEQATSALAFAATTVMLVTAIDAATGHTLAARLRAAWTAAPHRPTVLIPSPEEVTAVLSEAARYTKEAGDARRQA